MATIKKPFKIFDKAANAWNRYHLETDSTQVTHTKADGTDTTVAKQLLALNSTMTVTTGSFRNLSSKINNYSKATKMGNLVVLHLNFELKNAIVNGDCLIAVPSNMIPSDAVELSFGNASMRLNAGSGNITIRHNMPSGSWITGECVYLL